MTATQEARATLPQEAWIKSAERLTTWALTHLVLRMDCYGRHTPVEKRGQPDQNGKPIGKNYTSNRELKPNMIRRHFAATKAEHVLGTHSIGMDNTCRFVLLDIDHHGEPSTDIEDRNRQFAIAKFHSLRQLGFQPLLTDSNGRGGFHLRIIFAEPIPSAIAFAFGNWLTTGWQTSGLTSKPESFPKNKDRHTKKGQGGGWVRLPGRHHTRDVWATVFDGEQWLSGAAAVEQILSHTGDDPTLIPEEAKALPSNEQTPEPSARDANATNRQHSDTHFIIDRARKYVTTIPGAVSGQRGHDRTFHVACVLTHGFELSVADAFPLLAEWNQTCQPPWAEAELRHKLDDAANAPGPRGELLGDRIDGGAQRHTDAKARDATCTTIRNFRLIEIEADDEKKFVPEPLPIITIGNILNDATGGWPRRVGTSLFVPQTSGVAWLPDTDALFGFIGQATGQPPDFKTAAGFHTKREVFSYLIRTTTEYRAVEELPHEPLLADHFYACEIPSAGNGDALRTLIDRFSPETDIDRDLILSAFVTPFWGGKGGTRPAFCITSDAGKGCGKSTLAACIGQLAGGALDVSANEDIATVKARLLSPEGITKRVVWLDNVKSHRLSWAELESLITSPVISGKRMYVGEGQRPNTLTFVLTMNGVSLSTDMAQRSVVIKLKRPDYSGTWAEERRQFIESHRRELVADVLGFLRSPSTPLAKFTRWGDWERDILARLPEPAEAQAVIRERQVGVDVDGEESALIEEYFAKQLTTLGYDIKTDRVFIPSRIAARWFGWATDERTTVAKASRTLKQRITEGQLRRFMECGRRDIGRGFEFWGDDATGETYLKRDLEDLIRLRGENQVA